MLKRLTALTLSACMLLGSPGGLALAEAAEAGDAATVDGVEVAPDSVILHLSEQVKFNSFVTPNPPRIVIELLNAQYTPETRALAGQGKFLKRVRAGQYQKEPTMISRVVLDLVEAVDYQTHWEGSDLSVRLQGAPAPQAAAEKPAAAAEEAPKEAQKPAEAAPPAETPAPATPAPAAKPQKKAHKESGGYSSELSEMAASEMTPRDREAEAESAVAAPAPSPGYYRRARRDLMSTLPSEAKSVDYENVDVRDVLKHLAAEARINVIYGPDVSGPVTLHLSDVPFNEIFLTVLQVSGLVADQVGENVLRVMSPATLTKMRSVSVNQTRVIKLKYSKAADLKAAVDAVRKAEGRQGALTSDDSTNSLIVTDTLDGIASVERLLGRLDVRPQQVMIEAKLVEVTLDKSLNFGIQWDYLSSEQSKMGGQLGTNLVGTLTSPSAGTALTKTPIDQNANAVAGAGAGGRGTGVFLPSDRVFGAFTFGRITNNYFLSATLTAAASQDKVKVLSDPKIATLNGKKASINITTNIPYSTSNVASTGVTSQQVSQISTGIELDVTPTVNADGRITIEVSPTVSQPSATVASAVVGVPAVDQRTAKTTVLVQDGETIVIGGLITDSVTESVAKVPLLGDIPLIGWLFKKKSVDRRRVELLIFVTTRVLQS